MDRDTLPPLSAAERARYQRHLALPEVGEAGQRRLKAARVLLVGAGGLGSPAALYLAAAGVGTLGLVDADVVDVTNLHRQLLYGARDVGRRKVEAAADRLREVNPHVAIERHDTWLTAANARALVRRYDVVVDGADNFPTRYLVNDACVLEGRPNVHGSVFRFDGQLSVFGVGDGPCYRCLFPEPPPPDAVLDCATGGVLGVLPGLVGTWQAVETIKLLLGLGASLAGRLLLIDTTSLQVRTVQVARDPRCPACGTRTLTELIDYDAFCGVPARGGRPAADGAVAELAPAELAARLADPMPPQLVDVREPHEWAAGMIAGARGVSLGGLADAFPALDRARPLVLVCQGGVRSAAAARQCLAAGFTAVWSLAGGMRAWSAEGHPTGPMAAAAGLPGGSGGAG